MRLHALLWLALTATLTACGGTGAGGTQAPERPRLVLAGDGELWVVDVLAERAQRLALEQLAPGDPPVRVLGRGDAVALWGYDIFRLDPRRPQRAPRRILRDGWFFIASADPERLWVAILDERSPATVRALPAVREITIDGEVTVDDTPPPHGSWPQLAVRDGLLLLAPRGGWYVWNPRARRVVRRWTTDGLGHPGAAHGDLIASCSEPCTVLNLTNVRTGARHRVTAPRGSLLRMSGAAFSPDGATLAVPVQRTRHAEGSARLALVDVARRRIRLVAGSTVPPGYILARWSRDGAYAFVTGGQRWRSRTVVAYRIGTPHARRLRVKLGDFYDAAGA